ncbi:MAG: hypothetical protein IT364_14505 [Candidatus Hydrogenedentes bacterium]|nr:hypothetical protein [Candidatus Hydrogenedentota bacterium]
MRILIFYVALTACIVLAVTCWVLSIRLQNARSQVHVLTSVNADLRSKLEHTAALNDDSETEKLRTELAEVTTKLADAEHELEQRQADLSASQAADADASSESTDAEKSFEPPFVKMFKDDETIVASAGMQVNMQYAMLLADLKLPADAEEEVRGILTEFLADQIRFAVKAAKDGTLNSGPPEGARDEQMEKLRGELSKVLNAEEMAVWEDYEANKESFMLQQSYDMQLATFAPSISQETRNIVKQVLAEEVLAAYKEPAADGGTGIESIVGKQTAAFEQSLERLSTQLTEEEYVQVERFIQQQIQQTRTSQEMMRSMWGQQTEDKKPE